MFTFNIADCKWQGVSQGVIFLSTVTLSIIAPHPLSIAFFNATLLMVGWVK